MTTRRFLMTGLLGASLPAAAYVAGAFRSSRRAAEAALERRSSIHDSSAGPLEYAIAGHGPPFMMIHGTGGGFDQGLLFAHGVREAGFQIISPSRFGYLRSAFPADASPAHQADVLVELLDHLKIARLAVAGGSAGALTAAEFAVRHPGRCSHLILMVPAANLTGKDPVAFSPMQMIVVEAILNSDFWFWAYSSLAPNQLLKTLLATDPALMAKVLPDERRRAELIAAGIMPISQKTNGLRTDAFWAGTPTTTAYERIAAPTLIMSCEDDLFGTAASARLLAGRIPDAQLIMYPSGGHIWLGHDKELAQGIARFVAT